jgi:GNAT superfamily N-acetyltransferase
MKITIRRAGLTDLKTIQRLSYLLFKKEHVEYDSTLDATWTFGKKGTKYFTDVLKKGFAAIAEADGKTVGYIVGGKLPPYSYRTTKRTAELGNMFIVKGYRKKGIGTKLIRAFLEWCKKEGCKHIEIEAFAANKKGIKFYHKFGFKDYALLLEMNPENKRV